VLSQYEVTVILIAMGVGRMRRLEFVQVLILRRNCKKIIFNKANFAVECGQFGEKFNAVKNKIGQLQPGNQHLNKRLVPAERTDAPDSVFQVGRRYIHGQDFFYMVS
jgi:hypothetical protein